MKSERDIIIAHDKLQGILLGDVPIEVPPSILGAMQISCDVLCWILEHDHNDQFERNLRHLDAQAISAGYQLFEAEGN
jgi:hypothetical protein